MIDETVPKQPKEPGLGSKMTSGPSQRAIQGVNVAGNVENLNDLPRDNS